MPSCQRSCKVLFIRCDAGLRCAPVLQEAVGRLGIITNVTLSIVPNIQIRRLLDQMSTQAFINQIKSFQATYNQALADDSPVSIADALSEIDETQVTLCRERASCARVDNAPLST